MYTLRVHISKTLRIQHQSYLKKKNLVGSKTSYCHCLDKPLVEYSSKRKQIKDCNSRESYDQTSPLSLPPFLLLPFSLESEPYQKQCERGQDNHPLTKHDHTKDHAKTEFMCHLPPTNPIIWKEAPNLLIFFQKLTLII